MNTQYAIRPGRLLMLICFFFYACQENNQNQFDYMDQPDLLFNQYDLSVDYPYGKINPEAPNQTNQFDF